MEYGVVIAFNIKCDEDEIDGVCSSFIEHMNETAKMYRNDGIDIYDIETDSIECIDWDEEE